mmetsp:Transcript_66179/g.123535  ORF Transcript_66179/g.123535 Transcript_66179/m.123535 type:complete len:589 (+) Transcript_66179:50-1816(+)
MKGQAGYPRDRVPSPPAATRGTMPAAGAGGGPPAAPTGAMVPQVQQTVTQAMPGYGVRGSGAVHYATSQELAHDLGLHMSAEFGEDVDDFERGDSERLAWQLCEFLQPFVREFFDHKFEERHRLKVRAEMERKANEERQKRDAAHSLVHTMISRWEMGEAKGLKEGYFRAWADYIQKKSSQKDTVTLALRKFFEGDVKALRHTCFSVWRRVVEERKTEANISEEKAAFQKELDAELQKMRLSWAGQLDEADEKKRRAHDTIKAAREKFLLGDRQGTLMHCLHLWKQMTDTAKSQVRIKEAWMIRIAANFLDEDKGNLKKTFTSWHHNIKLMGKLKVYISTWFKGDTLGLVMTVFREWWLLVGRSIMVRHHQSQIQEKHATVESLTRELQIANHQIEQLFEILKIEVQTNEDHVMKLQETYNRVRDSSHSPAPSRLVSRPTSRPGTPGAASGMAPLSARMSAVSTMSGTASEVQNRYAINYGDHGSIGTTTLGSSQPLGISGAAAKAASACTTTSTGSFGWRLGQPSTMGAKVFDLLDTNHDGVISRSEFSQLGDSQVDPHVTQSGSVLDDYRAPSATRQVMEEIRGRR